MYGHYPKITSEAYIHCLTSVGEEKSRKQFKIFWVLKKNAREHDANHTKQTMKFIDPNRKPNKFLFPFLYYMSSESNQNP